MASERKRIVLKLGSGIHAPPRGTNLDLRQFARLAKEVAEVFPDLAVLNKAGTPETVKYQDLTPLLLNEVQKLRAEKDAMAKESAGLRTRLEKLEAAFEQLAR